MTFPAEPVCANPEWTCFTAAHCHLGHKLDLRRVLQLLNKMTSCGGNHRMMPYVIQHLYCTFSAILLLLLNDTQTITFAAMFCVFHHLQRRLTVMDACILKDIDLCTAGTPPSPPICFTCATMLNINVLRSFYFAGDHFSSGNNSSVDAEEVALHALCVQCTYTCCPYVVRFALC